jgi:hypothetical protein
VRFFHVLEELTEHKDIRDLCDLLCLGLRSDDDCLEWKRIDRLY